METSDYVIVPVGSHMIELIKRNHVNVVAAIDYRNNGGLEKAGLKELTGKTHIIGTEKQVPILSIPSNIRYYNRLVAVLDQYPDCKVIISGNYTPFLRFIIDHVGTERIELWEDGMNHYIGLEQISPIYYLKSFTKLLAGFYPKHIFDNQYKSKDLFVKDRFIHCNLAYDRPKVKGTKCFYIGQPLIEDNLIKERVLKKRLTNFFSSKPTYYLPHPREKQRLWLNNIFNVKEIKTSAEEYIIKEGASEIYSAFSTVNMNLRCKINVYLTNYLGLKAIDYKLRQCNFNITFR